MLKLYIKKFKGIKKEKFLIENIVDIVFQKLKEQKKLQIVSNNF